MGFSASLQSTTNGWATVNANGTLTVQQNGMYDEETYIVAADGHQLSDGSNAGTVQHGFSGGAWNKISTDNVLEPANFIREVMPALEVETSAEPIAESTAYIAAVTLTAAVKDNGVHASGGKSVLIKQGEGTPTEYVVPSAEVQYIQTAGNFDPVKLLLWLMRKARDINKLPL